MEILKGHTSADTAYVVDDYPYGYTLRCKIRYWLEYKPANGFRFVSQTTNPRKRGEVWNKPKPSTYMRFGGCMFKDEKGHVHWTGLGEYCTGKEAFDWLEKWAAGVPEVGLELLKRWVAAKVAYDANRAPGDPLEIGVVEARAAFLKAKEDLP
jgi:hypothetical protein